MSRGCFTGCALVGCFNLGAHGHTGSFWKVLDIGVSRNSPFPNNLRNPYHCFAARGMDGKRKQHHTEGGYDWRGSQFASWSWAVSRDHLGKIHHGQVL